MTSPRPRVMTSPICGASPWASPEARENPDYSRSAGGIGGQDGEMATKDVVLSLDVVALSLAERAAELSGDSLSEVVSACLNRHLLADYAPGSIPTAGRCDER